MAHKQRRRPWTLGPALALGLAVAAAAEPMDLTDPTPRWVAVRFERSPPQRPGRTDAVYSPSFLARLTPGGKPDEVTVAVPSEIVETVLMHGYDPVPGSFSEFVWTFDVETGHVRSAHIAGRIQRRIAFGATLEAPVEVRMDTRHAAGFGPPRNVLGHRYRRFCAEAEADCTLVSPRPYDRSSGYVNAVGEVVARSGPLRVRSFSPLGEAIFSELTGEVAGRTVPTFSSRSRGPVSAPPP
jgi:hypothetical protein